MLRDTPGARLPCLVTIAEIVVDGQTFPPMVLGKLVGQGITNADNVCGPVGADIYSFLRIGSLLLFPNGYGVAKLANWLWGVTSVS